MKIIDLRSNTIIHPIPQMRRAMFYAGKLADLCISDQDILNIEPRGIKDINTVMTIVGGNIVYDAG